jgi:hypothetical protein
MTMGPACFKEYPPTFRGEGVRGLRVVNLAAPCTGPSDGTRGRPLRDGHRSPSTPSPFLSEPAHGAALSSIGSLRRLCNRAFPAPVLRFQRSIHAKPRVSTALNNVVSLGDARVLSDGAPFEWPDMVSCGISQSRVRVMRSETVWG